MLSASIETATAVPWADLPAELCNLVVDRLDAFSALRFPAVCRSWAAACQVGPRRLRPGAPTLLTPILMDGNGMAAAAAFALYDVSTGRSFHASVSGRGGLKNRRWVGAKDDWLVTTDATCSLELLNPATGDLVRLPSFATIPGGRRDCRGWHPNLRRAEVRLYIGGGDGGVWRRVDGIGGDHALFVGQSYPFYVTVPRGSSDLKANSVYAADLNGYVAMVFDQCQGCAGGIGPFVYSDFRGTSLRPIWFRPTAAHLEPLPVHQT
ncbi:hypothetical protein HU200_057821 [Digitaria exilis]|uniref:F-box domain-containing protein n=1 Tax=Digitaria exilis TaxID=1010633 RepID=A0A835AGM1_9POAL|nr:hypothetical protein HU200_057821 [Digitaria exilis]